MPGTARALDAGDGEPVTWALDHLVVGAESLAAGCAWCEATLGVAPGPGGTHPLMGTHNRLLALASAAFPRAYLEIIAIDCGAPPPGRPRWFELDRPEVQAALRHGPRLLQWVARCDDLDVALATTAAAGIDGGEAIAAERDTAGGILRWRIGVRPDGKRPCGGALPALIEWGPHHPTASMAPSGLAIDAVRLAGLPTALAALLPAGIDVAPDAGRHASAAIDVALTTPRGTVRLTSV